MKRPVADLAALQQAMTIRLGTKEANLSLTDDGDFGIARSMKKTRGSKTSVKQSRWALYATAGAATALGGIPVVEGEIFYSGHLGLRFDPARSHVESAHITLDRAGDSINPRVSEGNSEAVYGLCEFFVRGVGGASLVGTRESSHGL